MVKRIVPGYGEEFLRREGLKSEVAVWEDGLRTDTGRGTFEWWYFDAHFDDGSTAVMVYATKPLLLRGDALTPMVTLTITRPDGVRLSSKPILYSPNQFQASKDGCQVRIGPSYVNGNLQKYELHTQGDQDWSANLVFTRVTPSWRPGSGMSYYDKSLEQYFAWLVPIPHGQVEGSLTYEGKTYPVRGIGYHDHNWGNFGLETALDYWYWGRAHIGDFTVIFSEMTANNQYGRQKGSIFMLAQGERLLADLGRAFTLETADLTDHPSGKQYPRSLDFHWMGDKGTVDIALRQPHLIDSFSLLEDLPGWQRWLARRFVNPYYFRFNTEIALNVNLVDTRATQRGSAIYELMMLH